MELMKNDTLEEACGTELRELISLWAPGGLCNLYGCFCGWMDGWMVCLGERTPKGTPLTSAANDDHRDIWSEQGVKVHRGLEGLTAGSLLSVFCFYLSRELRDVDIAYFCLLGMEGVNLQLCWSG